MVSIHTLVLNMLNNLQSGFHAQLLVNHIEMVQVFQLISQ